MFTSSFPITLALVLTIAVLSVSAGCSRSPEGDGQVTFMAGFKPQANLPFVGVYVAQEKAFFAEEDLEVKISHVNSPGDNLRLLSRNEAQFTTADAAAILERRAGDPALPIVAIALLGQRGQQGFAVLADSGIQSPTDWAGKTVGYKAAQPTPDHFAILEAAGVDADAVDILRVGFDPRPLTTREVDVLPVFLSNEPNILRSLGYDVRLFEAAEYGIPTLGLTYATSESYLEDSPDVVEKFLRASLRGIAYADQHREEAIDIVLRYAPLEERKHMRFMLQTELEAAEYSLAQEKGFGWMTAEQWNSLHDHLVKYGAIADPLKDIDAAYSLEIIGRIYGDRASEQ